MFVEGEARYGAAALLCSRLCLGFVFLFVCCPHRILLAARKIALRGESCGALLRLRAHVRVIGVAVDQHPCVWRVRPPSATFNVPPDAQCRQGTSIPLEMQLG